jgi:hypothetical protein
MIRQAVWDMNERAEYLRVHLMRSWMHEDGAIETPYIAMSDDDRPPSDSYYQL